MARKDALGDRIKAYEARETERLLMPGVPVVIRVDGRSFSTFTAGMPRPFDADFGELMLATAAYLLEEVDGARVAYTQSDEISLVLDPYGTPSAEEVLRALEATLSQPGEIPQVEDGEDDPEGVDERESGTTTREGLVEAIERIRQGAPPSASVIRFMFQGRIQKLVSVSAGLATARLLSGALALWPQRCRRQIPIFDARVLGVPSRREAVAALAWREIDAMRNAVSMAARARFTPEQMHGRSSPEMRAMLAASGVDFDAYPARFRRGVYLRRRKVARELDAETIARIPLGKRKPGPFMRSETVCLDLPPTWHMANAVEVLLEGAEPVLRTERAKAA